jgi:hypothetical protein
VVIRPVISKTELLAMQRKLEQVHVSRAAMSVAGRP